MWEEISTCINGPLASFSSEKRQHDLLDFTIMAHSNDSPKLTVVGTITFIVVLHCRAVFNVVSLWHQSNSRSPYLQETYAVDCFSCVFRALCYTVCIVMSTDLTGLHNMYIMYMIIMFHHISLLINKCLYFDPVVTIRSELV